MRLSESWDISPAKVSELLSRLSRLGINPELIEESFVKGGGPGGQKINKTANCVRLYYPPLNLSVRVQRERKRSLNRFLALRELADQIEMKISPETSSRLKDLNKIRRRKARSRRRAAAKYGAAPGAA